MKKWHKRLLQIVSKLGFGDKMKEGKLTADDQKKLFAEYETEFNISFEEDKKLDEDVEPESATESNILSPEMQLELASILGDDNVPATPKEVVPALTAKAKEQAKQIKTLEAQPEPSAPIAIVGAGINGTISATTMAVALGMSAHTPTHLFGIEHDFFARGRWFNNLTIERKGHEDEGDITPEQKIEFKEAVTSLYQTVKARVKYLDDNNMLDHLDYEKLVSGQGAIDYSDLMGQAGEYIIRRTDLILAYLRTLPTVDHLFPMVSNVQNKEVVPGANFGELSQGYRKGKIYKGRVNFTAEIYKVDALMFKFLFEDLIDLEKQYIGYLNREGSNVMKWTFIEWIMTHFGKILNSESNQRRIIGVRVPQQNVQANPAMFGADGVYRAIERVEEELKVLPFMHMKVYDESLILDYYEELYDLTEQCVPSMEGMQMYANAKHKRAYTRQFRAKYGKDNDFTGVKEGLIDISPEKINWVPNCRNNDFKVFITFPGNLENYEDKPNEMAMFYFEQDWEALGVMSRWKGGAGARQAGVKYKDLETLEKSLRKNQYIFTNFPATMLDADLAKVDASENTLFLTGENTAATAITDIENSEHDRVYKIVCGSMTNASTIAKAGKFAKISAAYAPKKVGDYIKLYAELEDYQETDDNGETYTATRPTGNFLELERKVSN